METTEPIPLGELLAAASISLNATATDRDDAIRQAGQLLLEAGAVEPQYIDAMLERERSVSTFVGEQLAIPHGTVSGNAAVNSTALAIVRFPDGVDWNGERVCVVIAIAAERNGHIALLSRLAATLLDPPRAEALRSATSADQVYAVLSAPNF